MAGMRKQMIKLRPIAKRPTSGRPLPKPRPGSMRPGLKDRLQAVRGQERKPIKQVLVKKRNELTAQADRKPVGGGTTPQRTDKMYRPSDGPKAREVAPTTSNRPALNKGPAAPNQNKLPAGIVDKVQSLNKKRKTY